MTEEQPPALIERRRRRVRGSSRPATVSCVGCGAAVAVQLRGPLPTWCSSTCRHRAWERRRVAAEMEASGAAVVVREVVETPVPIAPERSEWVAVLAELTHQIASHELPDGCMVPVYEALIVALNQAAHRDQEHRSGQMRGFAPHPALHGREEVIAAQLDVQTPNQVLARTRQGAAVERAARRYETRLRQRLNG